LNPAIIDGQSCSLHVLDTAGLDVYKQLADQWIRDAEGLVLVYSISSRSSFVQIQNLIERRYGTLGFSSCSDPPPAVVVPIMLVGNQCDKHNREISTQEAYALAQKWGYGFVETSAEKPENVEMAFYNVVRRLRLGEMQGRKCSQSQSTESGVPTVRDESIEGGNSGVWKRLFMLCGSSRRKKNSDHNKFSWEHS
jgi:GTPase KRas protein